MLVIIFIYNYISMLNLCATKWHSVCNFIGYNLQIQTWRVPYEFIREKEKNSC
jgi:hypothetical protein